MVLLSSRLHHGIIGMLIGCFHFFKRAGKKNLMYNVSVREAKNRCNTENRLNSPRSYHITAAVLLSTVGLALAICK